MNGKPLSNGKKMRNWNSSNKCSDWYKILINGRMKALLQKNFLRMYRNVG